jgi:hypothetical protein
MTIEKYQIAVARAARFVRRNLTPWRSLNEAAQTYRRQCRHVATLVHWVSSVWQEKGNFDNSEITTEMLWQLSGELFRMKHKLVQVLAIVSGDEPQEVMEKLQDADAMNLTIPAPQESEPQEDED